MFSGYFIICGTFVIICGVYIIICSIFAIICGDFLITYTCGDFLDISGNVLFICGGVYYISYMWDCPPVYVEEEAAEIKDITSNRRKILQDTK